MPALAPLLAPEVPGPPTVMKKAPRKLRRKNPPPSLFNNHQKLPSATSSMTSISNSRPSSSWSAAGTKSGGWFSRAGKSMDAGNGKNELRQEDSRRPSAVPLPQDLGLGFDVGNGGVLTPPGSGSPTGPSMQQYKDASNGLASPALAAAPPRRKRSYSTGSTANGGLSLFPPPIPPRAEGFSSSTLDPNHQHPAFRPKARTVPIDDEFLLPPTAPFSAPAERSSPSRIASESPVLPPLPFFQSGSLGIMPGSASSASSQYSILKDALVDDRPPLSPKHPGRKARSRSTSRSPQPPESAPSTPRSMPTSPLRPLTPPESTNEAIEVAADVALAEPYDAPVRTIDDASFPFHAVTSEEPIVLPIRSSTTSAKTMPESFPMPPETKKGERRGSFLGGWKLAMKNSPIGGRQTPANDAPVGVGSGGGWVYRRRNSFSSPCPPSAEKIKHSSYAQEYKEFRKQKAAGPAASTSQTAAECTMAASNTFAARAAVAGLKPSEPEKKPKNTQAAIKGSGSTRKNFKEKMKSVEARFNSKNSTPAASVSASASNTPTSTMPASSPPVAKEKELVGLDVAIRQMNLLEEQLKSGRPPSPPDSRDGEESGDVSVLPLNITKPDSPAASIKEASASLSRKSTSSLASFVTARSQPAPPPSVGHKKTNSLSPLRKEIELGAPPPPAGAKGDKGKGKEVNGSASGPSAYSIYPPPSEYLGKGGSSNNGPCTAPTPPKPVAKLFVICCRCKYWHDLPSAMYRGMVENGGATRCPYCLHGMETACCSGYTCVVYLHQRHH
ncbi:hypothetical protein FN846DRAFT_711894 [Sphaerosporella brunnea]|uniref:Uncharacterized protein n=1 Tax=Sphaerosporella brunnea TaxID=1250544 RepID=A0A5J5EX56_9PEZI|nr:hypothetical protein FN846DRAFT_711894 [Sphaerosporella brunnea]